MPRTLTDAEVKQAVQDVSKAGKLTARALADALKVSTRTAWRELHKLGTVQCPACLGMGRVWQEAKVPMVQKKAVAVEPSRRMYAEAASTLCRFCDRKAIYRFDNGLRVCSVHKDEGARAARRA